MLAIKDSEVEETVVGIWRSTQPPRWVRWTVERSARSGDQKFKALQPLKSPPVESGPTLDETSGTSNPLPSECSNVWTTQSNVKSLYQLLSIKSLSYTYCSSIARHAVFYSSQFQLPSMQSVSYHRIISKYSTSWGGGISFA